jgi:hypothetical protein
MKILYQNLNFPSWKENLILENLMDTPSPNYILLLPHFTVKYQPYGKRCNGNTSKGCRSLMGPDLINRPNSVLLLKMIIMILYKENKYLHMFEFSVCDAWAIVLHKFLLLLCVSSISYFKILVRINQGDIYKTIWYSGWLVLTVGRPHIIYEFTYMKILNILLASFRNLWLLFFFFFLISGN